MINNIRAFLQASLETRTLYSQGIHKIQINLGYVGIYEKEREKGKNSIYVLMLQCY